MEFKAKDYETRKQLERDIKNKVGGNIEKNEEEGHTIIGTAEELKNLYLSEDTKVFGCKCIYE